MSKRFDPRNPAEAMPYMTKLAQLTDAFLNGPEILTDRNAERELGFFTIVTLTNVSDHRVVFSGSIDSDDAVKVLRETADFIEAKGVSHGPGIGVQ